MPTIVKLTFSTHLNRLHATTEGLAPMRQAETTTPQSYGVDSVRNPGGKVHATSVSVALAR